MALHTATIDGVQVPGYRYVVYGATRGYVSTHRTKAAAERSLADDSRTGRAIGPRLPSNGTTRVLNFSPDGGSLAVADEDGTLRIWPIQPPVAGAPDDVARRLNVSSK